MADKERKTAHAPYNFVPLPDRVVPAESIPDHDQYYADRRTGYFDVKLTTETPLYIRGMLTEEEAVNKERHKDKSEFFQLGGKPIIPGSSLRGMIRALVEIITFSKLQPITDRLLIYRAVGDTTSYGISYRERLLGKPDTMGHTQYPLRTVRAGYLVQNGHGWAIRPAKMVNNESFVLVPVDKLNAAKIRLAPQTVVTDVYVRPVTQRTTQQVQKGAYINLAKSEQVSRVPGQGLVQGTLIVSGKTVGPRKYHPVIFEADPDQPRIEISDDLWRVYETDREMKRGIATRPLRNDGDPLFYLLDDDNNLVFFGPTMMFRLPPRHSVQDLIPAELKSSSVTDIAEAIFGWVARDNSDKRTPIASRVSVTDARPADGQSDFYEAEFTPKILGGPKPTTFQHYLEQPDGERTAKPDLKHYAHSLKETKIRGHKLYWRQKDVTVNQVKETGQVKSGDTQHTQMRPVRPGMAFNFRVYFENLSNVELGALAWALTLPGSAEHRHQLGMGKPYGMGVVKLDATLYLSNRKARYKNLFAEWAEMVSEMQSDSYDSYIEQFEQYICREVDHREAYTAIPRIKELLTMLAVHQATGNAFQYMTIKPNNEYKDRPVLPYPSVVIDSSGKSEQPSVTVHNTPQPQPKAPPQSVRKSVPGVGDEVKGEVFSVEGGLWFTPEGYEDYEAHIPKEKVLKRRNEGEIVKARVIEIRQGDPATLICEQIDPGEKKRRT